MRLPDTQPETPGKILDHDAGIGETSEAMVDERARELAKIAGMNPEDSAEDFHAQARAELRGSADPDAANDDDGLVADLSNYDDVVGESGNTVTPATNAGAGSDEQTIGESLYAEGISEATHDRMVESREKELGEARDEEK